MNKKCVQGWASFLVCFLFVFSLFSFLSSHRDPEPFQPVDLPVGHHLSHFLLSSFLMCLLFFWRLELRQEKPRGVCYGAVGGLDIVENHGLHGVGLATL